MCSNGDWYVSVNGNDNNTGKSINEAFATLDKALSMVNGEENLIVLTSGTHLINNPSSVRSTCTILGCGGAKIENTGSLKFFKLYPNISLTLQDVELEYDNSTSSVDNATFNNNNKSTTVLYVLLKQSGNFVVTASSSYVKSGENITITVHLLDEQGEPIENAEVNLYKEV